MWTEPDRHIPAPTDRANGAEGEAHCNDSNRRSSGVVLRDRAASDYLSTPALATFFEAREHEAYYRALKHVGPRRDFHERLFPVLERFIELTDDRSSAAAIDRAMRACRSTARARTIGTVLERAREVNPEGVMLLNLTEPVEYESLKSAYRAATKRHHPDVGGDHEAMVAVNEAFSYVHSLLHDREIMAGAAIGTDPARTVEDEPKSCADFRYCCGQLLFTAMLDDWNIDTAAGWLERITSDEWQRASKYARHPWRWIQLTALAGKLASRLAVVGHAAAARRALEVARQGYQRATEEGLSCGFAVRDAEAVLAGQKRLTVVVNHPRQAANAFRLGLLDEKRYRRALERFAAAATVDEASEVAYRQYRATPGFMQDLPTDRVARGKRARSTLVPETGYCVTRIVWLTDDQQAEYVRAFGNQGSLQLVRKYTFVRLVSLLESALFYPDEVDAVRAAQETRLLGALNPGSGASYGAEVAETLAWLASQPPRDRAGRAELLQALLAPGDAGCEEDGAVVLGMGQPTRVPLTPGYMRTIRRPLPELRTRVETGAFPQSAAERQERESWNRDLAVLRSPAIEASQEAAWDALDAGMQDPAAAITPVQVHCERLLALGENLVHVQELQLGYWVDRLSGALVRLRRWQDAADWLERYFTLPERYRERSNPSESDRLRRRLERCRKQLHRPR